MTAALDIRGSIRPADSYRPSAPGTDDRLQRLLAQRPLRGDGRFGCYRIADSSPYSDLARAVECEVFQEFFGNDPEVMTEAYANYETHSTFLLAVDRKLEQPAGALRIISNSATGLKTLNDIAEAPLSLPTAKVRLHHGIGDLDACWDVGTLAVLRDYRGQASDHYVSTMLYGLFYDEAVRQGIEHVVTILDKHAYKQLTEVLGVPFVPIAGSEPFNYLGSENSRAAYMHVPGAGDAVEAYMDRLDQNLLPFLKPYLLRLSRAEGLPRPIGIR
jgi:hypothetical protein